MKMNANNNTTEVKATKVLWFSRHTMTTDQLNALYEKLGPVELTQVDKTISSAYELQTEIAAADVIAIVAPINIQQQFLKLAGDKPVITAISKRELIPDENGGEATVNFVFVEWQRLVKIEVVTEHFA